ncbi:serine/threonine protein kinase [Streptomyces populi]|uniref:non-specific serine/threonine protein kinase n=1 Tax=Streptomyces populi TaxID=2058924 RepID=A0A2I0SLY5_9ACTN|nr:serine/threonine protein kinase [Streptomyces populi]
MASKGGARVLTGCYRLDGLIGSGGAADVHRGFDLRLRRPVAVKIFRAGTGFDTEEDHRSEAVLLARLQHQGLVTAYDAGRHDGDAYLVMQLIDGPTLKTRIAEGPLPWKTTATLGAGLADALAHAHEAGVVHRDVKPSNIILDDSGDPHLTDFGISRLLDTTTRTATGTLVGTAAYLSPEQVLGEPVGRPADVYALGLVLLECLTGRLEYDGGPLEAAIARLHRRPGVPDFVPRTLAALLQPMTALEAEARPTARDCARTLALLGAETAATVPTPPAARATSVVVAPQATTNTRDNTHDKPLSGTGQPAARTAPVRSRLRVAGAAAVLAAAIAAFAVTEGPSAHSSGGDRAASADDRAAPSDSPERAARDDGSHTPAATPTDGHSASARPQRYSTPGRSTPAGSPTRAPATGVAPTPKDDRAGAAKGARPDAAGQSGRKAPKEPPGQVRKTRQDGKGDENEGDDSQGADGTTPADE